MIKRILILFLFSFLQLNWVSGQNLDNSLLWKIEGQGIKTSYLFGTFHLLPQKDFLLKEKVTKAFKEAEIIMMELDMDDPTMQRRMMNSSRLTEGNTLEQFLNPEEINKLEEALGKSMGMTFEQVNNLKPFMVLSLIIPSLIDDSPASYEKSLLQMALDQGKEVKGLEKVEYQISVFDQIPYEDQIKDLLELINQKTAMKLIFDEMIQSYKDEDISEIYSLTKTYVSSKEELNLLVAERNGEWIPKIIEHSSSTSIFYAVGAAHLAGRSGLIPRLRAEGFKVTAVN